MVNINSVVKPALGTKIRAEDFGGILYHHGTGKLVFLRAGILFEIISNPGEETVGAIVSRYRMGEAGVEKILSILERLNGEGWLIAN